MVLLLKRALGCLFLLLLLPPSSFVSLLLL
jgi:hypothetical protein